MKAQCPLSISIVISDGVADVNHIPVISTIDGGCEILAWDQLLNINCASLNHLGGNGGPYNSLSSES